uniref:Uncharacterized protein n=1 Tax=Schistosoma curassoni TaxID=6186 RepID=A0A183KEY2_9TREM
MFIIECKLFIKYTFTYCQIVTLNCMLGTRVSDATRLDEAN